MQLNVIARIVPNDLIKKTGGASKISFSYLI